MSSDSLFGSKVSFSNASGKISFLFLIKHSLLAQIKYCRGILFY